MAANYEIYIPSVTFPSTKVYFAIDKIAKSIDTLDCKNQLKGRAITINQGKI